MKKNMIIPDRLLRLLVAAAIVILYMLDIITGTLGIVLLVIAGIFTITSLIGFCPLYKLLGINRSKKMEA